MRKNINPERFDINEDIENVAEFVRSYLDENRPYYAPHMDFICNKAVVLNQPKKYTTDLIYDLARLESLFTETHLAKSKNFVIYWFCRPTGTSLIVIDKDIKEEYNYKRAKDQIEICDSLWDRNKHHFKVGFSGCKNIAKSVFMDDIKQSLTSGYQVWTSL